MLKAIILDFNGVILNDEPVHFSAMRDTVAELGVVLTKEDYWKKYLPFDDQQCLDAICRDFSVRLTEKRREAALAQKAQLYRKTLSDHFPLFPGVTQFIENAAKHYPLALASGARREEIETALDSTGLKRYFLVIVAAEDFVRGKPHPESFILALERLNARIGRASMAIRPEECLVIEDSIDGVNGARAAGMVCIAVSNSYPEDMLKAADMTAADLSEVQLDTLRALFKEKA
jgi:HAD superfamily hydrolase (TIGR01509 family)